ncbi:MAG: rubrerythrin family protein, partial [Chloroflexi bacterium]|nr:rubrerythrin family protein [Chloroflexota bacterium]
KADEDGFPQVARLFRAAAAAETVHALNHFRALGEVKDTSENLKTAIQGEHYEATTMYPEFIQDAESEGEAAKRGLRSFKYALEVEKVHEALYRNALETLGQSQTETYDYYICPVCGFTHARNAPDRCPVCGTVGNKFERIS